MKEWKVIYDCDTGGFIDGFECESYENAKDCVFEILSNWATEEMSGWKSDVPSDEEKENWNCMVCNDSAWVEHYENGKWVCFWCPSDDDLDFIGWAEIE